MMSIPYSKIYGVAQKVSYILWRIFQQSRSIYAAKITNNMICVLFL